MINKYTKGLLYAEILENSSFVMREYEESLAEELNAAKGEEEKKTINAKYKAIMVNCQRIKNNAFAMLLRNGFLFYANTENWKDAKEIYMKINENIYSITMQSIRTILSGDTEKYLDKAFSGKEVANVINLSKVDKEVADRIAKRAHEAINESPVKEEKKVKETHVKPEPVKPKKEEKPVEKKEEEVVRKNLENEKKEPEKAPVEKVEERQVKKPEVQKKKPEKKETPKEKPIIPVVPVLDMDELFMDEIEELPVKEVKAEKKIEEKKIDKIISKPQPKKEEKKEEDILSIPEIDMEPEPLLPIEEPEPEAEAEAEDVKGELGNTEEITVKDLVMSIYNVRFANPETREVEQTFTIIIAPLSVPDKTGSSFIPTFTFAKEGKDYCTAVSPNNKRTSYQIVLGNETFVVRGKWDSEGFAALLYPQNTNNKKLQIQKKQFQASSDKKVGHNIFTHENGLKFHILPLSSKNAENGKVGILVCLEDPIEEKFVSSCTKENPYVDIYYNEKKYRITASWVDKVLKTEVSIV